MLLDSFAHAEDDVKARLLAEQRVEADGIVAAARAAMRDAPELLDDGRARRDRRARSTALEAARARQRSPARSAPRSRRSTTRRRTFATRRMNRALRAGVPRARAVDDGRDAQELGAGRSRGRGSAMPKVRFEPDGIEIEVPVGTSILEASQKAHAQVGSACGGVCACSTCHVYVKQGLDDLSDASDREEDILDKAFDVKANSRLGCQSKILARRDHRRRDQPREPPGVPRRAPRDPRGAEGSQGRRAGALATTASLAAARRPARAQPRLVAGGRARRDRRRRRLDRRRARDRARGAELDAARLPLAGDGRRRARLRCSTSPASCSTSRSAA